MIKYFEEVMTPSDKTVGIIKLLHKEGLTIHGVFSQDVLKTALKIALEFDAYHIRIATVETEVGKLLLIQDAKTKAADYWIAACDITEEDGNGI